MRPIRHILVAVDFHPPSMRALGYAARLAHTMGARVSLLHAYDLAAHSRASFSEWIFPTEVNTYELRALQRIADAD